MGMDRAGAQVSVQGQPMLGQRRVRPALWRFQVNLSVGGERLRTRG